MKQADTLILRELQAIGSVFGLGGGGGAGGGAAASLLALEDQTDGTNWKGVLRVAGSQVDGNPNRIIVQRYSPDRIAVSNALGAGNIKLGGFYLPKEKLITGLKWFKTALGTGGANGNNEVALFSYVPFETSITRRALSTNNATIWTAGSINAFANADFATPYLAPPGIYFGAMLYNLVGTAPSVGALNALTGATAGGTLFNDANFKWSMGVGGQATIGASALLSALVVSPSETWMALY